jgi:hypothetical protein
MPSCPAARSASISRAGFGFDRGDARRYPCFHQPMNRHIFLLHLALFAMAISGCAAYEEKSMAGSAVDIPDDNRWPQ